MVTNRLGGNTPSIVNPLPFGLEPTPNPFSASFSLTDISYDYALAGIPFLAGESLRGTYFRRMYTREFAPIRKDQFDNQQVPGEQSILGWWLRSQSNFADGAGVQFLDTTTDPSIGLRYAYSEGLDTMGTPGQVSLLQATKTIKTGLTGPVQLRGVKKAGVDGVLVLDTGAKTLAFVDAAGASTAYTMPGGLGAMSNTFTDDGTNYYYCDTTGVWQGVIATPAAAAVHLWNAPSASGANVIAWVKGRLVGAMDNNVYELVGGAPPVLPAPKFTHFNAAYTFSAISEIPPAILVSGSAGTISQIHKFTLDAGGALPTLTSGVVTTTMPVGEIILSMFAYIDTFVGIGTNKGFRVSTADQSANLVYGPLVVQDPTSVGVKAICGYDRFFFIGNQGNKLIPQQGWVNPTDASAVDMLLRVDLSTTTTTGSQPYAHDLMTSGTDGTITSAVNFGTSTATVGMLAFATGTKVWITDTANKQTTGFMYTSKVRYNTLEAKHFKFVYLRNQNITDGSMAISAQNPGMVLGSIMSGITGTTTDPIMIGNVGNAQEWLQFKFILNRGTTSTNYSPIWNGYQLRALPGVNRQPLITIPLICHDHEEDKYQQKTGYDGFAFARIQALEAAILTGNLILLQDLNYGVATLVVIDHYKFEQQATEGPKSSSSGKQDSNARQGYITLEARVISQ